MLVKGFALFLLLVIPLIIFTARKHTVSPKILFLRPTPSIKPTLTPPSMQTSTPTNMTPKTVNSLTSEPTIQPSILTQIPSQIISPTTSESINNFIYPNSSVQSQSGNEIIIDSSDDPTVITNWYKNKIQQMGMNTTSFITTNTNGNISNKLVAANGSIHINVDISKSSGNSHVTITVSLS